MCILLLSGRTLQLYTCGSTTSDTSVHFQFMTCVSGMHTGASILDMQDESLHQQGRAGLVRYQLSWTAQTSHSITWCVPVDVESMRWLAQSSTRPGLAKVSMPTGFSFPDQH